MLKYVLSENDGTVVPRTGKLWRAVTRESFLFYFFKSSKKIKNADVYTPGASSLYSINQTAGGTGNFNDDELYGNRRCSAGGDGARRYRVRSLFPRIPVCFSTEVPRRGRTEQMRKQRTKTGRVTSKLYA